MMSTPHVIEARDYDPQTIERYVPHTKRWTDAAYHGNGTDLLIVREKG